MKYIGAINEAEKRKDEIAKSIERWKKKRPKNLDAAFHREHESVFRKIDCLECANCCKTTSPIFRDVDIRRIAKYLKMKPSDFEDFYLKTDDEGDWVLKQSPCHFLSTDHTCNIYDIRPLACREYPHTDRKRMVQILDLTQANTLICPAVSDIVLNLTEKGV